MRNLLAAAAALLAALAVLAPDARAGRPKPFDHELHVTNNEAPCESCHAASGPTSPQVDRKGCGECHEEKIPAYLAPQTPKVGLAFAHAAHAGALKCLDCHAALLEKKAADAPAEPVMPRLRCAQCHSERGLKRVEARCEACHGRDQRKVKPKDHTASWAKRHGGESRERAFAEHGEDCSLCHGADTCVRCHRERRPESHTGLWRVRLHGVAAEWDRDGCKACHETGVCTRCHRTTRPLNHAGAWSRTHGLAAATTDNDNCRVCHTASSCAACHRPGM